MIIQVGSTSECCKSYYRRVINDKHFCNICYSECQIIAEKQDASFCYSRGTVKLWSKKKHRYLTREEIKRGERGG
jgi:hypothetical protein